MGVEVMEDKGSDVRGIIVKVDEVESEVIVEDQGGMKMDVGRVVVMITVDVDNEILSIVESRKMVVEVVSVIVSVKAMGTVAE